MVVAWNEFSLRQGKSAELSKDIEPSKEHGDKYVKLLKEEIANFKSGEPPERAPTARWLGVDGVALHFARPGRAPHPQMNLFPDVASPHTPWCI